MRHEPEREEGILSHLHPDHPTPAELGRFLRGEALRDDARAVVRHLLAGCGQCLAVTRPVWKLEEPLGTNGGPEMIEGARQEMRATAGDLKSIRYRLLGVHAGIPPSPQEASREDLEGDPDVETELRTVIANGIQNCLDPLIDDLLAAAEYQSGGAEGDPL
jgi:hypothetical protein